MDKDVKGDKVAKISNMLKLIQLHQGSFFRSARSTKPQFYCHVYIYVEHLRNMLSLNKLRELICEFIQPFFLKRRENS